VAKILLIDDDREFSESLRAQLQQLGHEATWLDVPDEGLRRLTSGDKIDLVLLDNKMQPMSGLEFLAALTEHGVRIPVILMTSVHQDQTVIQAMNLGAFDYLPKPDDLDEILPRLAPMIRQALEITRQPPAVQLRPPEAQQVEDDSLIVGRSKPMLEVLKRIGRLARVDETVLILGETGTGKDLVAQAIHTNSPRKHNRFVVINCTALNENLLDDELFGHEPGAFTGADRLRKGRFEHAVGGTLFLDEVGDMPLPLQAKLLRVLENHEVVRIGSNEPIRVDVRVLAATFRDLQTQVREGKFRQDLFYRLEGMTVHLPPLRERKEDIELLAYRFLSRLFGSTSAPTLHPQALAALRQYSWPGNIRQLQKVLCRAAGALPARSAQVMPEHLDFGALEASAPPAAVNEDSALAGLCAAIAWVWQSQQADVWPVSRDLLERELLRFAQQQLGANEVQMAERLGMARNTVRKRLKDYGLK
jgi:DNA-binding NtrC family response regulator